MFVHSAAPRVSSDEEIAFVREFAEHTRIAVARRAAESALYESEASFYLMADAVPQFVWSTDAEGSADSFKSN